MIPTCLGKPGQTRSGKVRHVTTSIEKMWKSLVWFSGHEVDQEKSISWEAWQDLSAPLCWNAPVSKRPHVLTLSLTRIGLIENLSSKIQGMTEVDDQKLWWWNSRSDSLKMQQLCFLFPQPFRKLLAKQVGQCHPSRNLPLLKWLQRSRVQNYGGNMCKTINQTFV